MALVAYSSVFVVKISYKSRSVATGGPVGAHQKSLGSRQKNFYPLLHRYCTTAHKFSSYYERWLSDCTSIFLCLTSLTSFVQIDFQKRKLSKATQVKIFVITMNFQLESRKGLRLNTVGIVQCLHAVSLCWLSEQIKLFTDKFLLSTQYHRFMWKPSSKINQTHKSWDLELHTSSGVRIITLPFKKSKK